MTAVLPVQDWDQSWVDYDPSAIRVRFNPVANALVLLLSVDNGDGTFTVSTFNLSGALRDTRESATQWPAYVTPPNPPSNYVTSGDQLAAAELAAQSRANITTPGPLAAPVSGSSIGN